MLTEYNGKGSFNYGGYKPLEGTRANAYVPEPQANDPGAWPWLPYTGSSYWRNFKGAEGGPRLSNGWAPTRGYVRGIARTSVSGELAVSSRVGSTSLHSCFGLKNTIPGSDVALYCKDFGEYLPNQAAGVSIPSGMLAQAETELLVKLADRKVHLGTALAESGRTVGMIAKRTIQVLSAYRALRRGDIRGAAGFLGIKKASFKGKTASDLWLEWQYGWKPLLNDIYGFSQELREKWEGGGQTAIVRVARQLTRSSSHPSSAGPNSRYAGGCSIRVRALAFYHVEDEWAVQLSSLGLLNPLEIAWELTPFSFVIDWFLPVGNFLTALTAHAGMTFVDGCFSVRADGDFVIDLSDVYLPGWQKVHSNSLRIRNQAFCFTRLKMTSPPTARIYMKDPLNSETRAANALALLHQLNSRR